MIRNVVISLVIILLFFSSCSTKLEEITAFNKNEEMPDVTVKNIVSTYSTEAHIHIKLTAPLAYKYTKVKDTYLEFPEGILLLFYDKDMSVSTSLKADYAIYYENKNVARAEKNVIMTNKDGGQLFSEQLFYDEKKNKIYSPVAVKIVSPDSSEINGSNGFESNPEFTVYKFSGVTGTQNIRDVMEEDEANKYSSPEK